MRNHKWERVGKWQPYPVRPFHDTIISRLWLAICVKGIKTSVLVEPGVPRLDGNALVSWKGSRTYGQTNTILPLPHRVRGGGQKWQYLRRFRAREHYD